MMENIKKQLGHCAIIYQIFGQQYFSIGKLSPESQRKFPSVSYTIYFVVLFLFLTSHLIIFISMQSVEIQEKLTAKTSLNYIVQHSLYIGLIAIMVISLIQAYATTPTTKKLFLNFIKISKFCQQQFQHSVDYKSVRFDLYKTHFYMIFIYAACQLSVCLYELNFNMPQPFFRAIFAIVPQLYLNMATLRFIFYVKIMNHHLETISLLFAKIFESPTKSFDFIKLYVKPSRTIYRENIKLTQIMNLRNIYNIVYENCELINRTMDITLLSFLAVSVIGATGSGYRLLLAVVGKIETARIGGILLNYY